MRAVVTIPDRILRDAEALARRLGLSRSQLYTAAVAEYIERRERASTIARINAVCDVAPTMLDPALHAAQLASINRESWWEPDKG